MDLICSCLFLMRWVSGGLKLQGRVRTRSGGHLTSMRLGRVWAHAWEGARSQARQAPQGVPFSRRWAHQ